jgi:hypothetical protein
MKIKSLIIAISISVLALFTFSACDKFESFPINIPISVEVFASGSSSTITETKSFCLDADSPIYQDYQDKIQSLTFLQAAYRTLAVSSANLQGNIRVKLETQAGLPLFDVVISNVKPSDYINNPLVLNLTQAQIQAINAYISILSNKCFRATVSVENISGATAPYSLTGVVDVVMEADTKL